MEQHRIVNRVRNNPIPIARSGYPFILVSAMAAVGFALIGFETIAILGAVAALFITFFFRDPERRVPKAPGAVVSPADGRVISIEAVSSAPFFSEPCRRISIFMTVFNVHVNRVPYEGRIGAVEYRPGSFMAANRDRASELNERNAILVNTERGTKISVVQVAGWIARRIVCAIRENEPVARGERFGLIRFGSRVDVYLPDTVSVHVKVGQRVKAGASIIGYLK
ncbi:MAG: phosphatidylserine decarboxylase family protein [Deltaproteobacteria bacterium]|nr:phosphatidylserine decarboxylase family protein [Deltaproteobacteria bacterium]